MELGVIALLGFLAVLALRPYAQQRVVLPADEADQPKRQFVMDLTLCLLAAVVVMTLNRAFLAVPLINGYVVLFGGLILGFFLALDTALARERANIKNAVSQSGVLPPPQRLYSMTRKFSLVAFTAAIFVAVIVVSVLGRDIVWLSQIEQNAAALARAQWSVAKEMFFIMAVLLALVVNLIVSYSRNLRLLFTNQTDVLERVSRGDLSRTVPVATRDEFGLIAGHTNSMIHGLRHRTKLITALKLAEVNVTAKMLSWVRAGHEPALLYDPTLNKFKNLTGEGLVLGVDSDYEYRQYSFQGWAPGSVVVVGTDGIQETRNTKNEMFGLDRLRETVAQNSTASAAAIQTAVIERLNQFRGATDQEDDVTLVVVKLL